MICLMKFLKYHTVGLNIQSMQEYDEIFRPYNNKLFIAYPVIISLLFDGFYIENVI